MACRFYIVLLAISLLATESLSSLIICVDNFENSCLQCDVNVTLNESLQGYLDKYNASTKKEIILCSTEVFLQARIAMHNVSFVSIDSYFEFSTISCRKNDFGICFINTKSVTVRNIKIQRCGSQSFNISTEESNYFFQTSLYFLNSSNITINGLDILDNQGIGLTLINCNGSVVIQNSRFERNFAATTAANETIPGGNGLYIEFYNTKSERDNDTEKTNYTLKNCIFDNNTAHTVNESDTSYTYALDNHFQGQGRGGGLCIHFRGYTSKIGVKILNCNFSRNKAIWGGGAYFCFHDSAEANEVYIDNSTFRDNNCTLNGGGGVDVGFLFTGIVQQPKKNKIVFQNSLFLSNQAEYGGGALVYSGASSNSDLQNVIKFTNCTWEKNRAVFGAAVNLGTHSWFSLEKGILPTPIFTDCLFVCNFINSTIKEGKGTLAAVNMDMSFEGKNNFTQNNSTALYLVSSNAKFGEGSDVVFQENRGKTGGAIAIVSSGSLEINDNSNFSFIGNRAREKGGAIYQTSHDINDYVTSRSCFIQYKGRKTDISDRNIHFTFENNTAGSSKTTTSHGHSIFAGTLKPCFTSCLSRPKFLNETFDCIASFGLDKSQIATTGENISLTNTTLMLYAIPGAYMQLPLTLYDELGNEVNALYHVYLTNRTDSTMSLSENYVSDKWIKVFGQSGDKATLQVETVDISEVAVFFRIILSDCPPGFALTNNMHNQMHCECKATSNNTLYKGIVACDEDSFVSTARRGFWYGYDKHGGFGNDSLLMSGYCLLGYCNYNSSTILLPNSTNISQLDLLICGNRTGRLCGECRENFSALFHTNSYECSDADNCKYGLLFYLLADILPITIFFIVTIMLDINFTHGAINGLILYFQVTDIHIASGFVTCDSFPSRLQEIYALLSGPFNLKFFYHPNMSFCLWHEIQTLDILAFRYVNIVYALCLVIAIISITRAFSLKKIGRKLPKFFGKNFNIKTTIIHGLSGFLVICYSECSKISLLLLTAVNLHYENETKTTVALFNGELDYFRGKHLVYALPAVFFLIVMGFIPPLLFISYPLCYRIFALLKIGESLFTKTLCRIFPFERIRPFFDSFQSSFKDEYRFFSGLYFLYRMITLLTFVTTISITNYLTVLLVEDSIILCLHAIVQPYKKRWHNLMDACIFTNLLILTTMTLLNYKRTSETFNNDRIVKKICVFETLFLCAPMVFFLIIVISQIIKKFEFVKIVLKPKDKGFREQELSENLLFAGRDSITDSMSHN